MGGEDEIEEQLSEFLNATSGQIKNEILCQINGGNKLQTHCKAKRT